MYSKHRVPDTARDRATSTPISTVLYSVIHGDLEHGGHSQREKAEKSVRFVVRLVHVELLPEAALYWHCTVLLKRGGGHRVLDTFRH